MHIGQFERRQCPAEFQDRLTRLFGKNQFGDPNFKIAWAQTQTIRMGNLWRDRNGRETICYRDYYQGDGTPCWMIMQWMPPSHYGSPASYYDRTFDELTHTYHTAEYPWRGRYEIRQPLRHKEYTNGRLVIEHFPLSHYMIDTIIPMILAWQRLTLEQQIAANKFEREQEEKRENELIAEQMMENLPVWMHPVSYGYQGCRTSLLDKKMEQIQKVWDRLAKHGLHPILNRGITQTNRPVERN